MASVTITLSDHQLQKLQSLASLYGIGVETLLQSSLDTWLDSQNEDFTSAADHVLTKNAELYKRLA